MKKIKRKTVIEKLSFPVDGYKYNVQIWRSVDGGQTYAYCGCGKFFHTEADAQEYAASIQPEEEW